MRACKDSDCSLGIKVASFALSLSLPLCLSVCHSGFLFLSLFPALLMSSGLALCCSFLSWAADTST